MSASGGGGLVARRRVLKYALAGITKSIDGHPNALPCDRKTYYRDFLADWFRDMTTLKESAVLTCDSDDEFDKFMEEVSPLNQSYHDTVIKLGSLAVVETAMPGVTVSNPEGGRVVNMQYEGKAKSITALKLESMDIEGDLNISIQPAPNPLAGERIYFNIRGAPPSFFGRKSEMEALTTAFRNAVSGAGEKSNVTNSIVLHGIPGAGKTSLAAAFVNKCKDELKDFHVLWISAESKRSVRDQLVQACEISFPGLPIRDKQGKLIKDEDLMSVIYNILSRTRVLIIFDNAASASKSYGIQEDIAEFFCSSVQPGAHQPVYLITTRTGAPEVWKGCNANMIPLGSFNEEDCWNFMKKELPVLANYESECQRLCAFFARLPIAIEHAVNVMTFEASFCKEQADYNPGDFISMALEFEPASTQTIEGMDMKLYGRLNQLWDYSLELLSNVPEIGKYAIHVLDVMALLSSTGIPENFLRSILEGYNFPENTSSNIPKENMEKFMTRTTGFLKKFSCLQKTNQLFYVHVLMQEHRRKCLKSDARLEAHVVEVVKSMIAAPHLTSFLLKSEYANNFKNLEEVCNAILKYTQNNTNELRIQCGHYLTDCLPQTALRLLPTDIETPDTLGIKSLCNSKLGNYKLALEYAKLLFDVSEKEFGKEDPGTLTIKNNMASFHSDLGDYVEALRLTREVYDSRCSLLGEEHPDTLVALNNMASYYSDLEDHAEALRLSNQVYECNCRILGKEHAHTLIIRNNMATFHSHMGNYLDALALTEEVHKIQCRTLGEDHPDTLIMKSNLGNRYFALGKYSEALQVCKEVHDSRCLTLGKEHPAALSIKSTMANCHTRLGNYAEALVLFTEVYSSRCSVLGENHPSTLSMKKNMGNCHSLLGNSAEAIRLYEEVYDTSCRVLGEEHLSTLSIKNNIALRYSALGDYVKALPLYTQVYESRRKILHDDHPDTVSSKNNIAISHYNLGNYAEAIRLSREVYNSRRRILEEEHEDVLSIKNRMAISYSALGDHVEALRLSEEVYACRLRTLGEEHVDTLGTKSNVSSFYSDLGNHAEAVRLSEQVYDSYRRLLGEDNPITQITKSNTITYHSRLGNYAEANRLSREVYEHRRRSLGEDHPDTLTIKKSMADRYAALGKFEEAHQLYEELHVYRCGTVGEDHAETVIIKNCLANACSNVGEPGEALRLYREVYDYNCRILGEEHLDTLAAKSNMANAHLDLGDYKEALRLSKDVHDVRCRVQGEAHPDTLIIQFNMGNILWALGDYAESIRLVKNAYDGIKSEFGESHQLTTEMLGHLDRICFELRLFAFIGKSVNSRL